MKKATNWQRYYAQQMDDPETRRLVEEELRALKIGTRLARLRQEAGLTQTQLAARVGMSAPNISRIESSPGPNLTVQTLVKLFGALDHEVEITARRRPARSKPRAAVRKR